MTPEMLDFSLASFGMACSAAAAWIINGRRIERHRLKQFDDLGRIAVGLSAPDGNELARLQELLTATEAENARVTAECNAVRQERDDLVRGALTKAIRIKEARDATKTTARGVYGQFAAKVPV